MPNTDPLTASQQFHWRAFMRIIVTVPREFIETWFRLRDDPDQVPLSFLFFFFPLPLWRFVPSSVTPRARVVAGRRRGSRLWGGLSPLRWPSLTTPCSDGGSTVRVLTRSIRGLGVSLLSLPSQTWRQVGCSSSVTTGSCSRCLGHGPMWPSRMGLCDRGGAQSVPGCGPAGVGWVIDGVRRSGL